MGHKNFLFTGLALVALGATGCGPDIAGFCEQREACLGGNEADIDACIAASEGQRDAAYGIGCGEELDVAFECTQPLLDCSTQATGQMCATNDDCGGGTVCSNGECSAKFYGVPASEQEKCEAEENAFSRCN